MTLNVTNNHVEEEARILQSLISRRVDGVIVEGTKTAFPNPNVELYRRLEKMACRWCFSTAITAIYPIPFT